MLPSPVIWQITDSIAIHGYGVMIALGVITMTWCMARSERARGLVSFNQIVDCVCISLIAGLIGGRLVSVYEESALYHSIFQIFAIWDGGISILGAIFMIALALPFYLRYHAIPIIPTLDLAALYAPLAQSIARLGCLWAGCCHGYTTFVPWAIIYTDPASLAPLHVPLHPVQLYSSIMLFMIWVYLKYISRTLLFPGQLCALYFMLAGAERWLMDLWRNDHHTLCVKNVFISCFSGYQWMAVALCAVGSIMFLICHYRFSSPCKTSRSL